MESKLKVFRKITLLKISLILLYLYAMIHGAVSYNTLGKIGILWGWLFVSICTILFSILFFYEREVNKLKQQEQYK